MGSTEPPHHQLTRAATPGDPQARGVHPPAPKTQHGRPGSRGASRRHAATRGRPARGAAPSCRSRSGVQGRPLPREVTLLPSPHVALARLSVPGPCGEFTGGGVQPQDPGSWGGGVTGSPGREPREGGPRSWHNAPQLQSPHHTHSSALCLSRPEAPASCSPGRRRQPGRQPTSPPSLPAALPALGGCPSSATPSQPNWDRGLWMRSRVGWPPRAQRPSRTGRLREVHGV